MLQAFSYENADPLGLIEPLSRMHLNRNGSHNDASNEPSFTPLPYMTFAANESICSFSVAQPVAPGVIFTHDKSICYEFRPQNPDFDALSNFMCNFSPGKTTSLVCDWISIDNGTTHARSPSPLSVAAMKASFEELASAHRRDGNITLTVASLDELARRHGITAGKWMMFCTTGEVDMVWEKVARFCMEEMKGYARVSPNKGDDQHVVSVYVEDFEKYSEVMRVREALKEIGFNRPIGFKMDAYTLLGIYRKNPWGINCNRYYE
ncbi:hypothetical protein E1B28_012602 [Marasmius oreades]|uniref:DUF1917-domain-containing protein n=1 Tax=Marasmius oreades TaxID=181124 RepID=A0A9P7RSM2_9AGAR|nr:uncharacterized protein E1B28_012602 [Marasmius oreades]KAG7088630.1 hypothetical protein E1B28_012602 [Marasmius oreades]